MFINVVSDNKKGSRETFPIAKISKIRRIDKNGRESVLVCVDAPGSYKEKNERTGEWELVYGDRTEIYVDTTYEDFLSAIEEAIRTQTVVTI